MGSDSDPLVVVLWLAMLLAFALNLGMLIVTWH